MQVGGMSASTVFMQSVGRQPVMRICMSCVCLSETRALHARVAPFIVSAIPSFDSALCARFGQVILP